MNLIDIAGTLKDENVLCICGHNWDIHGYRLDLVQRGLGAFDCNSVNVGLGSCECLDFKEKKV